MECTLHDVSFCHDSSLVGERGRCHEVFMIEYRALDSYSVSMGAHDLDIWLVQYLADVDWLLLTSSV